MYECVLFFEKGKRKLNDLGIADIIEAMRVGTDVSCQEKPSMGKPLPTYGGQPDGELFAAITRLLWWGFALYTLGILSGFFTGHPLPRVQAVAAIAIWLLYGLILQARHLRWLAPKRVATLCILGFSAALTLLWGITFMAELHPLP